MKVTSDYINKIISLNKAGNVVGMFSVCTANKFVLEASMLFAKQKNAWLVIEATSNQVNQFGGYTNLTPFSFKEFVISIASKIGFPIEKIILGGDHLGPYVWREEGSVSAMEKAKVQVAQYVEAGFCKLHIDASMACADDMEYEKGESLNKRTVSMRTAVLCKTIQDTCKKKNISPELIHLVIGSDVPLPGGEEDKTYEEKITSVKDLEETIDLTKDTFNQFDLSELWQGVAAVVVKPGVEFSDSEIIKYDNRKVKNLVSKINEYPNIAFEAHSTDYQSKYALREMVKDHFAILKVGPWLTYSLREAIFSLSQIEKEWISKIKSIQLSHIQNVLHETMKANPKYWKNYYTGTKSEVEFACKYSYSDRVRYYWANKEVEKSLKILLNNFTKYPLPLNLISQYFPDQYEAISEGSYGSTPFDLINHRIMTVLEKYYFATSGENI